MPDFSQLSRRERQIMEILFASPNGEATVRQIQDGLPDPPTPMAIRRLLSILVEKGHLARRKQGREVIYRPKDERQSAGRAAFRKVLDTFFGGSLESAVAAHFDDPSDQPDAQQLLKLRALIDEVENPNPESRTDEL